MSIRIIIFSVCIVIISPSAFSSSCEYANGKSILYYSNGMFNSGDEISTSARRLRSTLVSAKCKEDESIVKKSVNHNEFLLSQLIEVARQNALSDWSLFWGWLGGGSSPQWFKDATQDLASQADKLNYLIDEDLQSHVTAYAKEIEKGNRVVVIAHSQGNFYANAAYDILRDQYGMRGDYFGVVSVGTPDNHVARGGPFTTLTNDFVISGVVNFLTPSTLDGNMTNDRGLWCEVPDDPYEDSYIDVDPVICDAYKVAYDNGLIYKDEDWRHHSFIKSYLRIGDKGMDASDFNVSGPKILNDIESVALSLEQPLAPEVRAAYATYMAYASIPKLAHEISSAAAIIAAQPTRSEAFPASDIVNYTFGDKSVACGDSGSLPVQPIYKSSSFSSPDDTYPFGAHFSLSGAGSCNFNTAINFTDVSVGGAIDDLLLAQGSVSEGLASFSNLTIDGNISGVAVNDIAAYPNQFIGYFDLTANAGGVLNISTTATQFALWRAFEGSGGLMVNNVSLIYSPLDAGYQVSGSMVGTDGLFGQRLTNLRLSLPSLVADLASGQMTESDRLYANAVYFGRITSIDGVSVSDTGDMLSGTLKMNFADFSYFKNEIVAEDVSSYYEPREYRAGGYLQLSASADGWLTTTATISNIDNPETPITESSRQWRHQSDHLLKEVGQVSNFDSPPDFDQSANF